MIVDFVDSRLCSSISAIIESLLIQSHKHSVPWQEIATHMDDLSLVDVDCKEIIVMILCPRNLGGIKF